MRGRLSGIGSAARRDIALWRRLDGVSEAAGGGMFTQMRRRWGKKNQEKKSVGERKIKLVTQVGRTCR